MVERQKQKQTVIVNILDKVVKRKRKRKPRKKAVPGSPPLPPAPPPSQDFARVIYQAQAMRPPDNLAVQLNAVTAQLEELKNKQLHKTGNLMAATAAIARAEGEQGSVLGEAPAPATPATPAKKGRRKKEEVLEAQAMGFEDKTRRPYVKKQTKAEEAAAILLQQSGVMGGGRQPSLADFDGGSGMSSITMTPGLQTPAAEPAKPKPKLKIVDELSPTPDTSSLSGTSFGGASSATEPRF